GSGQVRTIWVGGTPEELKKLKEEAKKANIRVTFWGD
nr:Chain A, DS119 [synthetic construct]